MRYEPGVELRNSGTKPEFDISVHEQKSFWMGSSHNMRDVDRKNNYGKKNFVTVGKACRIVKRNLNYLASKMRCDMAVSPMSSYIPAFIFL